MENSNQTNCTCSLVHFNYQITRTPACSNYSNGSKKHFQAISKKSKVSLSRSSSGLVQNEGTIQSSGVRYNDSQGYQNGYQRCNIYQGNIEHKPKKSIFSAGQEQKLKKKYIRAQMRTEKAPQKFNSDLEKTQNTALDNSIEQLERRYTVNKRASDLISFSFFNQNKSDSKVDSSVKYIGKDYREKPGGKENTYSHPTNFSSFYEAGRKIKTLKQLEYKNVESSGGATSENHVSMIMSISESKSEEVKDLSQLARKSSSFTRIPKTTKQVA